VGQRYYGEYTAAWPILSKGGRALDAVEAAAALRKTSRAAAFGLAAWPDRDGKVTLDSCVMDGNGDCGAVSFIERIKHPVSVARKVMETTPHVLLSGEGAQRFAVRKRLSSRGRKASPMPEKNGKNGSKNPNITDR
jgi:N4-(beta-N-acetylglucosaminyl)-L-asparaginase